MRDSATLDGSEGVDRDAPETAPHPKRRLPREAPAAPKAPAAS